MSFARVPKVAEFHGAISVPFIELSYRLILSSKENLVRFLTNKLDDRSKNRT